jgi:CBS domain-containing protein
MPATTRPLTELTAGDLMSRDVLVLRQSMPLREAARLLLLHQIGGAPVVEPGGTCVGVLSTTDLLRWTHYPKDGDAARFGLQPQTCLYQIKERGAHGEEKIRCTLPSGVCSVQRSDTGPLGEERVYCTEPHSVLADWQNVQVEELPTEDVGAFMTSDPVLVTPETPVTDLARHMIDAHIHRLIVVDHRRVPIGVVSSTDLLALIARAGAGMLAEEPAPV